MNPFNIEELFTAAARNPKLNKPYVFSKHAGARYLRAKARWAHRKYLRKLR